MGENRCDDGSLREAPLLRTSIRGVKLSPARESTLAAGFRAPSDSEVISVLAVFVRHRSS